MRKRFVLIAAPAVASIVMPANVQEHTSNIGTASSPTTLNIAGPLTNREPVIAIPVPVPVPADRISKSSLTYSQFRQTNATEPHIITGFVANNGMVVQAARLLTVRQYMY